MNTKSKFSNIAKHMVHGQTFCDVHNFNLLTTNDEKELFLRFLPPERLILFILSIAAAQYIARKIADELKRGSNE